MSEKKLDLNNSAGSTSSLYHYLKESTQKSQTKLPSAKLKTSENTLARNTSSSLSNLSGTKLKSSLPSHLSTSNLRATSSKSKAQAFPSVKDLTLTKRPLGSTTRISNARQPNGKVPTGRASTAKLSTAKTASEATLIKTTEPSLHGVMPGIVGSFVPPAAKPTNTRLEAQQEYSEKVQKKAKESWQQNIIAGKVAPAPGTMLVEVQNPEDGKPMLVSVPVAFNQKATMKNFKLGTRFMVTQKQDDPFDLQKSGSNAFSSNLFEENLESKLLGSDSVINDSTEDIAASDSNDEADSDEASDIDEDLEFNVGNNPDDENSRKLVTYPPSRFQSDVYVKTHPENTSNEYLNSLGAPFDPLVCPAGHKCPEFYLSQAYLVPFRGHDAERVLESLQEAIKIMLLRHKVLRTCLSRNERIVDADVQANIPYAKSVSEIECSQYFEVLELDASQPFSLNKITDITREKTAAISDLRQMFKVVYLDISRAAAAFSRLKSKGILLIIACRAVADELSLSRIAVELSLLTSKILSNVPVVASQKAFKGDKDALQLFYKSHKVDKYAAKDYFKKLTTQLVQDDVLQGAEKVKVEQQLEQLSKEQINVLAQQKYLVGRKEAYGNELAKLRQQRIELENDDPAAVARGGGELVHFTDKITNETVTVTPKVRQLVVDAMLNQSSHAGPASPVAESAATSKIENPVVKFLEKHEFDADTIAKIDAKYLQRVEVFASLDDIALSQSKLLTKQKRKLLALSDFVANRLLEAVRERAKVLLQLERVVSKTRRTWEEISAKLDLVTDHLDYVEDMTIRLKYLLDPPLTHMKTPVLTFKGVIGNQGIFQLSEQIANFRSQYSFCPLMIDEETVQNLRSYRHAFHVGASHLRKSQLLNSLDGRSKFYVDPLNIGHGDSSDSGIDSSGESTKTQASDNDRLEELLLSTSAMFKPCDAACLAAFGVLMRHVSGLEDFLIGNHVSYRRSEATVGPLTDTIPIAFHLKSSSLMYNQLLGNMIHQLRRTRRYGYDYPSVTLQKDCRLGGSFPVQFQYITFAEAQRWKTAGLSLEDVLLLPSLVESKTSWSRLWSVSNGEQFDLKLTLIEQEDAIIGGFHYNTGRFDAAKVERWATKFLTILKSIDATSTKKISLNGLVSKFYQSAWAATSPMDSNIPFPETLDSFNEDGLLENSRTENWSLAIHRRKSIASAEAANVPALQGKL